MKKQVVRLNESQLKQIIKESVKRLLNEENEHENYMHNGIEDLFERMWETGKYISLPDDFDKYGLARVVFKKDGTYGLINTKGEEIVDPGKYKHISGFNKSGISIVRFMDDTCGLINTDLEEIVGPGKYLFISMFDENGLSKVHFKDGTDGYINTKGEEYIPKQRGLSESQLNKIIRESVKRVIKKEIY